MSRLWDLVETAQAIDPEDLAAALEEEMESVAAPDYRTRVLMEECAEILSTRWDWRPSRRPEPTGEQRLRFPSLQGRVVRVTRPETIERLLREVGRELSHPVELVIGGSSALILQGILSRATEDVDVVDEVPEPLRELGDRLRNAERRHRMTLAHFQSHYLPDGWESRLVSLGERGRLKVYLVDPVDIFAGKLFSRREKDRDDLPHLAARLDRDVVTRRVQQSTAGLRTDPKLLAAARDNWYILYGTELPEEA